MPDNTIATVTQHIALFTVTVRDDEEAIAFEDLYGNPFDLIQRTGDGA